MKNLNFSLHIIFRSIKTIKVQDQINDDWQECDLPPACLPRTSDTSVLYVIITSQHNQPTLQSAPSIPHTNLYLHIYNAYKTIKLKFSRARSKMPRIQDNSYIANFHRGKSLLHPATSPHLRRFPHRGRLLTLAVISTKRLFRRFLILTRSRARCFCAFLRIQAPVGVSRDVSAAPHIRDSSFLIYGTSSCATLMAISSGLLFLFSPELFNCTA